MSNDPPRYDPRRPDPEIPADERYSFADPDPVPVVPPPPPQVVEPEPVDEEADGDEPRPRKKKKKRKPRVGPDGQPVGEVRKEHRDRILDREEVEPAVPWWAVPAVLTAVGFLLCLIPIGVVASKAGAEVAAIAIVGTAVAVVVQVTIVSTLMTLVGGFFGIDYGPLHQALAKLVAIITMMDGVTGTIGIGCIPAGVLVAGIVGFGLFQYQFRLAIQETFLTVGAMVVASWSLNAVIIMALANR
ncbi:hypothetical protein [Fimbriiglobus ruber]|uniref:Uncharacterized protein n=1 Tax=Fimbriiglobus ruber TaxID=1908690 RepID=A0A225DVF8_9BACT|nr:hypothetical protein [Fimbriiglobus ruber]OWK45352.1 hypothetical protein FRUB_01683 [Fimbriiglobus ruber]